LAIIDDEACEAAESNGERQAAEFRMALNAGNITLFIHRFTQPKPLKFVQSTVLEKGRDGYTNATCIRPHWYLCAP
jgi:hypothetical protein